nr:2-C-methyl-D-erythritol 4-phosphate cytidylyltransferase [Penaeicola halotolerans]
MGAPVAKQYLEIGGMPVLMHTLLAFERFDAEITLILVIPELDFDYWKKLCKQYEFEVKHLLVAGGASRFQSVYNGLQAIKGSEGLVAIHDGVRPFVSSHTIQQTYEQAAIHGSAVAVVLPKDSIRVVKESSSSSVDRAKYRLVQTPQTFRLDLIKKAFEQKESPLFTDDASVYESAGGTIFLTEGSYDNIKITTPEDLIFADHILRSKK